MCSEKSADNVASGRTESAGLGEPRWRREGFVFTILVFKISAFAAVATTPLLTEQQGSGPAEVALSSLVGECSAADHVFAFHDDSALAEVTMQSRDPAESAVPVTAEREVFIPSPGTIALLGVGAFAMRRKRNG